MTSRKPVDGGLSGLGLVMQLGGALFGGFTAMLAIGQLAAAAGTTKSPIDWMMVLWVLGVVRSLAHRAAGTQLIEGPDAHRALLRYLGLAAIHTAAWMYFVHDAAGRGELTLAIAIVMGGWPLAIAVAWLVRAIDVQPGQPVPVAPDRGFDGLGCLMAVLGVGGLAYGVVNAIGLYQVSAGNRTSFELQALMLGYALLIVRSALHVRAAAKTLTTRDLDQTTEAASRYGNAGVTIGCLFGILVCVTLVKRASGQFVSSAVIAGVLALVLAAWPAAVRRFVTARRFAGGYPASARAQQASDNGLSSLGWLLLALGTLSLGWALPAVLWPETTSMLSKLVLFGGVSGSPELQLLSTALQLWAAIELIGGGSRARPAALAFGAGASAITLYMHLPVLKHLGRLAETLASPNGVTVLAGLAFALVVPATTFALAVRTPPPPPPRGDLARVFE